MTPLPHMRYKSHIPEAGGPLHREMKDPENRPGIATENSNKPGKKQNSWVGSMPE